MSPKKVQPNSPSGNTEGVINFSQNSKSNKTDSSKTKKTEGKFPTRIIGGIFVILGLGLVGLLIALFVISRLPYRTDPKMPIPTLDKLDEYTKDDKIDITGEVTPGEKVRLYQDGELLKGDVKADKSGDFKFDDVELEEEGETKFQAVTVSGTIFKKRSEKSNVVKTKVDWSAPSGKVKLEYEKESSKDKANITGEADKNSYVILRGEDDEYETKTNDKGKFEFEEVELEEGKNEFKVSVKDEAGNEVLSSSQVEINYDAGDVNGDGASTGDDQDGEGGKEGLPESAGELEAAMDFLLGNKLMLALGLVALAVFASSSASAYLMSRKRK